MQHESPTLDESIGFALSQAARAVARDLQARLNAFGITPPQLGVLTCLWEEDAIPATLLGERAGFDAPTTTGILDRLERQELITRRRRPEPEDRRIVDVCLTERGAALRDALPRIIRESNSATLAGLPPLDVERLRETLRRILENLHP